MAFQLVVLTGPLEGQKIAVTAALPVGRTTQGINLPDPRVNVTHARFELVRDELVIVDLHSKHGTLVNDTTLEPEVKLALRVGDIVQIGESRFRIDTTTNQTIGRILWAMLPAWVLVLVALVALFWVSGSRPLVLTFQNPIRAPKLVQKLQVPEAFARTHGLSLDRLALLDVRDDDHDGIDELWLAQDDKELVVTFDPSGTWRARGLLQRGCQPREDRPYPELDCDGTVYQLVDGRYQPVLQQGAVVWMGGRAEGTWEPPPEPSKKGKKAKAKAKSPAGEEGSGRLAVKQAAGLNSSEAVVPIKMEIRDSGSIAGFLAERGVNGAVQYVLCEDQGLGLPAQARLDDGQVVELTAPCAGALQIFGAQAPAFAGARVLGVAFTATGAHLLPQDLSLTVTGAVDDRSSTVAERDRLHKWRGRPVLALSLGVGATSPAQGFRPEGRENQGLAAAALITPNRVPESVGGNLLNRGVADLAVGGCTYRVTTRSFTCSRMRGCMPWRSFVEVREIGCGEDRTVMSAGYGAGITRIESEHAVVQLDVTTTGSLGVTEVVRARVGIRPR